IEKTKSAVNPEEKPMKTFGKNPGAPETGRGRAKVVKRVAIKVAAPKLGTIKQVKAKKKVAITPFNPPAPGVPVNEIIVAPLKANITRSTPKLPTAINFVVVQPFFMIEFF
ncbi:unnamed protein product, partial [marine sediment metagenome]